MIQRFLQYLEYKGVSIYYAENRVGVPKGTFYRSLRNNSNLNSSTMEKILDEFKDLNANWLLSGSGEMLISSENDTNEVLNYYGKVAPIGDRVINFFSYANVNILDASKDLEVRLSTLYNIGDGTISPSASFLIKLLFVYPDLSAEWLMRGTGPMLVSQYKEFIIDQDDFSEDLKAINEIDKHISLQDQIIKAKDMIIDAQKAQIEIANAKITQLTEQLKKALETKGE